MCVCVSAGFAQSPHQPPHQHSDHRNARRSGTHNLTPASRRSKHTAILCSQRVLCNARQGRANQPAQRKGECHMHCQLAVCTSHQGTCNLHQPAQRKGTDCVPCSFACVCCGAMRECDCACSRRSLSHAHAASQCSMSPCVEARYMRPGV